jgi:hypothetical protein
VVNYYEVSDFVCVDLDRGGSVALGHIGPLDMLPPIGTRVIAGERLGTVNPPGSTTNQGGYAHIHVQLFPRPRCPGPGGPGRGDSIPFDDAHDSRFWGATGCEPDLPYDPDPAHVSQWRGQALTRDPLDG